MSSTTSSPHRAKPRVLSDDTAAIVNLHAAQIAILQDCCDKVLQRIDDLEDEVAMLKKDKKNNSMDTATATATTTASPVSIERERTPYGPPPRRQNNVAPASSPGSRSATPRSERPSVQPVQGLNQKAVRRPRSRERQQQRKVEVNGDRYRYGDERKTRSSSGDRNKDERSRSRSMSKDGDRYGGMGSRRDRDGRERRSRTYGYGNPFD